MHKYISEFYRKLKYCIIRAECTCIIQQKIAEWVHYHCIHTCPPAAHAATSAYVPSSLISLLAAVVTRRQPVAPKG